MSEEKLHENEKKIAFNEDFRRRLVNYTHKDINERITSAWMDTDEDSMNDLDYSSDFVGYCETIIKVRTETKEQYFALKKEAIKLEKIGNEYGSVLASMYIILEDSHNWRLREKVNAVHQAVYELGKLTKKNIKSGEDYYEQKR